MGVLFKIWFLIAVIATIVCLYVFIGGLLIIFQKNEFPDIEDV